MPRRRRALQPSSAAWELHRPQQPAPSLLMCAPPVRNSHCNNLNVSHAYMSFKPGSHTQNTLLRFCVRYGCASQGKLFRPQARLFREGVCVMLCVFMHWAGARDAQHKGCSGRLSQGAPLPEVWGQPAGGAGAWHVRLRPGCQLWRAGFHRLQRAFTNGSGQPRAHGRRCRRRPRHDGR